MKTSAFSALAGLLACARLFAQGDLLPPGPPAPMMKSLDQIEARTIVNDSNTPGDATARYNISQPGSYYLTGNLAGDSGRHGIRVTASDVTLDLNGFALLGAPDSRQGIVVESGGALPHFALRRGVLRGWPEGGLNAAAVACALEHVRATGNGGHGLQVGADSRVLACTATGNTAGSGIVAGHGCQILDCAASANSEDGIEAGSGGMVRGCTVRGNGVNGISVLNDLSVLDNHAEGNGGPEALDDPAQILVNGTGNRIEGNTTSNSAVTQRSIRADNGGNAIVRNRFRGPGSNLMVGEGNTVGPVVTLGTINSSSNPHANLFF